MSLNGAQALYLTALNGLTSPHAYDGTPLQAWIQPPPVVASGQAPQLFIWGAEMPTHHGETYMQTKGFFRIEWWIEMHLMVADDLNSPTINSDFACMIEAIQQTLRFYPVVVNGYQDPQTGGKSNVLFVGNEQTASYPFVTQLEPEQLVSYRALLRAKYIEDYRPVDNPTYATVPL